MTESIEESIPTPEKELEDFRDEIVAIAAEEKRAAEEGQHGGTWHFGGLPIARDEITSRDLALAKKIKDGTVTRENLSIYRDNISGAAKEEERRSSDPNQDSSTELRLVGYLTNKATPIIGRRELEAYKLERERESEL